jgi:hypothetical protein
MVGERKPDWQREKPVDDRIMNENIFEVDVVGIVNLGNESRVNF